MAEEILKLQIGDVVQLQHISPDRDDRYTVSVIGLLEGESLLVTAPSKKGKVQFFRDGQKFAVRMLRGSQVYGFMTAVLKSSVKPYPYLHLSFPKEIESITVRNAERVVTSIPAAACNTLYSGEKRHWQAVVIKDLSTSGVRLESVQSLGKKDETIKLSFKMEVCGSEEDMDLIATIRNSQPRGSGSERVYCTGAEFHDLERFYKVLLHDHVLDQKLQRK